METTTTEKQIYTIRLVRKDSGWYSEPDYPYCLLGKRVVLQNSSEPGSTESKWKDGWYFGWMVMIDDTDYKQPIYVRGAVLKKWNPDV